MWNFSLLALFIHRKNLCIKNLIFNFSLLIKNIKRFFFTFFIAAKITFENLGKQSSIKITDQWNLKTLGAIVEVKGKLIALLFYTLKKNRLKPSQNLQNPFIAELIWNQLKCKWVRSSIIFKESVLKPNFHRNVLWRSFDKKNDQKGNFISQSHPHKSLIQRANWVLRIIILLMLIIWLLMKSFECDFTPQAKVEA